MRFFNNRQLAARLACLAMVAPLLAIVSGCSATVDARGQARAMCEQSFGAIASSDSAIALDATFRQCASFDDWLYVAFEHPDLLAGQAPVTFLRDRCADSTANLDQYAVCGTLRARLATPSPSPKPTRRATPRPTRRPSTALRPAVAPAARPRSRVAKAVTCTPGYSPCIPLLGTDVDCGGGGGDGPRMTRPGTVYRVTGPDRYRLDADGDGLGCERGR